MNELSKWLIHDNCKTLTLLLLLQELPVFIDLSVR